MSAPVHPIAFETWVSYWAGDLEAVQAEAVEEHAMACAECTAASARVAEITEAVRASIAPVLGRGDVAALIARGLVVDENPCVPGVRKVAVFRDGVDVLIHRLGGLDLTRAAHVAVRIRVEGTGDTLIALGDVPFEVESGEVLIACQRHFAAFPPDIMIEVRAQDEAGAEVAAADYPIPHRFEARAD